MKEWLIMMHDAVTNSASQSPPKSRRSCLRIVISIFVILILAITCFYLLRPGPLWLGRMLGFCPVDITHTSPAGNNKIRVLITDGGATGYGGILVYQRTSFRGHQLIWQENKVVAIPDTHSVKWNDENEFQLSYDSANTGRVVKTLTIK